MPETKYVCQYVEKQETKKIYCYVCECQRIDSVQFSSVVLPSDESNQNSSRILCFLLNAGTCVKAGQLRAPGVFTKTPICLLYSPERNTGLNEINRG